MMREKDTNVALMKRCIELGRKGALWVTPNPMVGCIIVKDGKIIAEAFHRRFGGPHAEVLALGRAGAAARGATLYVNLEPCSHYGKTPPCAEAIIRAGIARVIAAAKDPNPRVSGKGFHRLREAGISTLSGVCARETVSLNERFFHFMRTGLPFVGIKVAQTLDGIIADFKGTSQWITGEVARREGHRLRAQYHAVLVGATTALHDNPYLTVRAVNGRNPVRIILDGRLRVSAKLKVFKKSEAGTFVITTERAARLNRARVEDLQKVGTRIITVPGPMPIPPSKVLEAIAGMGITSVLIEGGGEVVSQFIEADCWNKFHLFIAPKLLGDGRRYFTPKKVRPLSDAPQIVFRGVKPLGHDLFVEGYPKDGEKA
jgi:diaminohydroxyphosphoribosylaminopyrimidine deaminase/5-amino-6-(5-phosphoribosylamino)uracil reductase